MSLAVIALTFGIVLIAELPDKSMFASLVLGTRFAPRWVFIGAASAFLVHVVIAVTAGSLLTLLPKRVLDIVVAGLFLLGAAFLLHASRSAEEGEQEADTAGPGTGSAKTAIVSSFTVIFIGEWGDITQIATANLAAKYDDALAVGIGAVLGLWTTALLAITLGRSLLRLISVQLLHRIGAVIFLALAGYTVVEAVRGS